MIRSRTIRLALALAVLLSAAAPARAGLFHHHRRARRCQPTACVRTPPACARTPVAYAGTPVAYAGTPAAYAGTSAAYAGTSPQAAPAPAHAATGDTYGFGAWLNAFRARHGLHALAHDPGLDGIAAANNAQQHARGMGHHVRGDRRQNAGWGQAGQVWQAWTTSPGHWEALLDRTVTTYGIAASGPYWTYSAN